MKIETILVPTDFSEHSEKAYAEAIHLAKTFGARIHLLHVYDIPNLATVYEITFPDRVNDGIREAALRKLDSWTERATAEGVEASIHIEFGAPARIIADYAREAKIDLIVIGKRGLGAIRQMLMGSVAERTARAAPCPVLIVGADTQEP
jgi:nucleotide-binding universal stress UspA family protein